MRTNGSRNSRRARLMVTRWGILNVNTGILRATVYTSRDFARTQRQTGERVVRLSMTITGQNSNRAPRLRQSLTVN